MNTTVTFDQKKGIITIPSDFYQMNKQIFIDNIPYFSIKYSNERYTVIQTIYSLKGKTPSVFYLNGVEKKELSCFVCQKRVQCTTDDTTYCPGYTPHERYHLSSNELSSFLNKQNVRIIFSEVNF